jgi:hypothetical protein
MVHMDHVVNIFVRRSCRCDGRQRKNTTLLDYRIPPNSVSGVTSTVFRLNYEDTGWEAPTSL